MPAILKTRLTEAGNIYAGPGQLHWLILENESDGVKYVLLNDATSSTTGEVIKFRMPASRTITHNFTPPIPFSTGIRIGTFEHANTRVVGGYNPL